MNEWPCPHIYKIDGFWRIVLLDTPGHQSSTFVPESWGRCPICGAKRPEEKWKELWQLFHDEWEQKASWKSLAKAATQWHLDRIDESELLKLLPTAYEAEKRAKEIKAWLKVQWES